MYRRVFRVGRRWLHPALRSRVKNLCDEYARLENEISKTYSEERAIRHGRLFPVIESYQELQKLENEVTELRELSKDPQLGKEADKELETTKKFVAEIEDRLGTMLIPEHPFASKACLIEIRPGVGGGEACLFAKDLIHMYQQWCLRHKWNCKVISESTSESVLHVTEPGSFSDFQYEAGVHRVQRVPATEQKGRVHTSTAAVLVLPDMGADDNSEIDIKPRDLRIDVMRASGSGGQHVNTTESAVRVVHVPTNLIVTCQDERSQHKNKAKAMRVLKARLAEIQRQKKAQDDRESRVAQVSSTDRSDRIRTYNFPQNRVTDHRCGWTSLHLEELMSGNLDTLVENLKNWGRTEAVRRLTTETAS